MAVERETMKNISISIGAVALFMVLVAEAEAGRRIKIATLAPEGTSWMKVMHEMAKEVKEKTAGEVKLKFYAGGVMGDEGDVIRKVQFGQVHGGGFTGRGLGEINSEERILELPGLFSNDKEVDCVLKKVSPHLESGFEKNGYVLLGWVEVGHVYIFTNKPVRTKAELKGVKMWMWEGDPLAQSMFRVHGLVPVQLDLPNVLTSMQTGLIDGIYSTPYATVAMQWHTRVKYMVDFKLAWGSGALAISKKEFDKLTAEQQKIVKEVASKHCRNLTSIVRQENKDSMVQIKKAGIKIIEIKDASKIEQVSRGVYKDLVGKLYDQDLLDKVIRYRDECHAGN
jgi:TRAP-type C4-dicarboxylate transport system substrate-binding protein